jgi:hypothetical protein
MSRGRRWPPKSHLSAAFPHQVRLNVTSGLGTRFWPMFHKLREIAGDQHADWPELRGLDSYTTYGFQDPAHAEAFRAFIAAHWPELLDLTPSDQRQRRIP